MPETDALGRPVVAPSIKDAIDKAFTGVDGRGALLVIADEKGTRAQLAAKFDHGWRVAGGAGVQWAEKKPIGYIAIERVW